MTASTADPNRKIKLGTFLTIPGAHVAAWRQQSEARSQRPKFERALEAARVAEEALFDLVLVTDVGARTTESLDVLSRLSAFDQLEPITLLSALAVTTRKIGLIATASTTFCEPYDVARKFASLDHLSDGRVGWNVVTTMNDTTALNYNREHHDPHLDRYERAEEFVDVVRGLWDSWEDDAILQDQSGGRYFDPAKLHVLHHKGAHFSVRGPLDLARAPQGHPIIVQAGSSEPGKALGARIADVTFSTQQSLRRAQAFYSDVKARAARHGRRPGDVLVLMALIPVVGASQSDAEAKFAALQELIDPAMALAGLSSMLGGIDLSHYPTNGPFPTSFPEGSGITSRRQSLMDLAMREGLTLGQLATRVAGTRGHWTVIGTPQTIADQMETWFTEGGADGFLLVPPCVPESLADFATHVVPELQRRKLYRTAYEGQTLRDRLGLDRPLHTAAAIQRASESA